VWVKVSGTWRNVFAANTGVFGGGYSTSTANKVSGIDYIIIITPGNATFFGNLTLARAYLSATSNGANNRGVFGGGSDNAGNNISTIDYITITTTGNATFFGYLTVARAYLSATSNGTNNRGVFGGGYTGNYYYATIDYITITTPGNAALFGSLTVARYALAATSNGTNNRGVFGGGSSSGYVSSIDYIDITNPGNASYFGSLSPRAELAATSNGTNNRGVFGGGYGGFCMSIINYITITTPGDAANFGNLTLARSLLSATSNGIGNRGVFGGGYDSDGYSRSTIDYITITTTGNATSFGYLTLARHGLAAASNA
jgi:hypothetical protein